MDSKPKNILITGGSSGIGAALALHYAAPGVFLALSGRDASRLEEIARQCQKNGAETHTAVLDVTDRDAMANWVQSVDQKHPLDLVIANAGISGGTGGFSAEPASQVRDIFNVNITGVLNTVEPALNAMTPRQSGQIALISSLAGFRGFSGAPAYCASKAAVRSYGEGLRGSLAGKGVKINVVCPGFVKSRMTDANDFPMPFLLETPYAASLIAKGLKKNKGRIVFPRRLYFFVWLLSTMPDAWAEFLINKLPAKPASKDSQRKNVL